MARAHCDMRKSCRNPVTHIGEKGYVYCGNHAPDRHGVERVRKMQPWELRWVNEGKTLPSYKPGPEPKTTFSILADGLDCCVDPKRGWTAEHERAKNLADAAPVMLETLGLICAEAESWHSMHHAQNLIACDSICALIPRMQAAIALAKRGQTTP